MYTILFIGPCMHLHNVHTKTPHKGKSVTMKCYIGPAFMYSFEQGVCYRKCAVAIGQPINTLIQMLLQVCTHTHCMYACVCVYVCMYVFL